VYVVPFKTPLAYFLEGMKGDPRNINRFPEIQKTLGWDKYDCDLHIYPYVHAKAAILSAGCKNKCYFCPTAKHFKGEVYYGDPEKILPHYAGQCVHFMDENFFLNDMIKILPMLKRLNITWSCMATYSAVKERFGLLGEGMFYRSGLRLVEIGFESSLMLKVKKPIPHNEVELYYLNVTFLPNETKASMRETARMMKAISLERPIHHNNGLWYAPGQFYYPYEERRLDGIMLISPYARTVPTYVPYSFLGEDYKIVDLEKANYYGQLVYGLKYYPPLSGNIREFISGDYRKAMWIATGIRSGGIV